MFEVIKKAGCAVILITCLSACATAYMDGSNPLAIFGGYWSRPGPGKLTTVGFGGNGLTPKHLAFNYALRRCAELAKQEGKPYFLIFETPGDAVANKSVKSFPVFAFGSHPFPVVYMLPQDHATVNSFNVEEILKKEEGTVQ